MKNVLRITALILVLFFTTQVAKSQNGGFFIEGPEYVCPGQCEYYYVIFDGTSLPIDSLYITQVSGIGTVYIEFQPNQNNAFLMCFDVVPDLYEFEVGGIFQGEELTDTFSVLVDYMDHLEIYTDAKDLCPATPAGNNCDKVCEFSTITYFAESFGQEFIWSVSGAESYIDNYNEITVTWGSAGPGLITLETFGQLCTSFATKCIEILPTPSAEFETIPGIGTTSPVCKGQEIYITNNSTGAVYYQWDFGNGMTSEEASPSLIYHSPGTYIITLIALNECLCSDTTSVEVTILDTQSPFVDCVGTICENESVTYTSDADCGTFDWSTSSNGIITEGGGTSDNFVTIDWGEGPEGIITLEVSNCTNNYCLEPSIVIVPIMSDNATIEGEVQVCKGAVEQYSIQDYSATYYDWTVVGGNILAGQGTSLITIEWTSPINLPAMYTITVNYDNCYLECGGSDQLDVNIVDEYYFYGPSEVCEGSTENYTSRSVSILGGPVLTNWNLIDEGGTNVWSSSSATSSPNVVYPDVPGLYMLVATAQNMANYCNQQYKMCISVVKRSDPVDAIIGDFSICPGTTYQYSAVSLILNAGFNWQITGGNVTTSEGQDILVTWNSNGPYTLEVTQTDYARLACESLPISMGLSPITGLSLVAGSNTSCVDDITSFMASDLEVSEYIWTIMPSDAGTVITDNHNKIEVVWHKPGMASVIVDVCGLSEAVNVNVFALPEPEVSHPVYLCEGESVTVTTTVAFDSYDWLNENGVTISTLSNPNLLPGSYEVHVTDINGCVGKDLFTIEELPAPNIRISSPDDTGICLLISDPYPTIYALDSEEGYTYEWFLDNVSLGITTPIIATSSVGYYTLVVTDPNGCTNRSNFVNVFDYCQPCPGGVCNGNTADNPFCEANSGGISFSYAVSGNCDEITFTNTSVDYSLGSLEWVFGDTPSGTNNQAQGEVTFHRFTNAGFYTVELFGMVEDLNNLPDSCISWKAEVITVPISADFEIFNACPGQDIEFIDLSTYLVGNTISTWNWNFGDPASGAANTSGTREPTHNFTIPGAYDVTLSISDGICTSTFTKTINIRPYPDPSFQKPDINCEATASLFEGLQTEQISLWSWDFGDPSSGAANNSTLRNAYHTFETPGNYTVTLTGESIYGCIATYTNIIEIESNLLSGDILSSEGNTICEDETTVLSSPAGGISWNWSNGALTETTTVGEEDIYSVTITDIDGCQYTPTNFSLNVLPAPLTSIAAVEYNEFGVVIMSTYEHYETCEGEDIYIQAGELTNHSYLWSEGMPGTLLEFSEDRNNLLAAGDYSYSLDLTNNATGCSNEIGPFSVTVHPLPDAALIVSSQTGYLCAGELTTLTISNFNASNIYLWNTGENASSITVETPGIYFVKVFNAFGCENESNQVEVHAAPDIGLIPSGCLERCNPDTICLPAIPNIASYQWFFEGVAIPAPNGTSPDFVADQSGTYHVVLTDVFGCIAQSGPLTLNLIDPLGTINGSAYYDVNEDGVYDTGDTVLPDVKFYLNANGAVVDSIESDANGIFIFEDVPSVDYTITVDLNSLDPATEPYLSSYDVSLSGCDDSTDLLCLFHKVCGVSNTTDQLTICEGDFIIVDGKMVDVDTTIVILALDQFGCDSISTVVVKLLEINSSVRDEYVCYGEGFNHDGTEVMSGETLDIKLVNQFGCDSIVQLNVWSFDEITFDLVAEPSCAGVGNGEIEIENVLGYNGNLEYSLDGIDFNSSSTISNLSAGTYATFVKDGNGCISMGEIEVEAREGLDIFVEEVMLTCEENSVVPQLEIIAGDLSGLTVEWSNGINGMSADFDAAGTYQVVVSNICESVTTSFQITAEDPTNNFHMANVFSPNGDGHNDYLRMDMYDEANTEILNFQVFDRWGGLVYEYKGAMMAWDGNRNGKMLPQGVYVYKIDAIVKDCRTAKEIHKIGDITLVR